jgi:O-succinylbenzoic acid--CoA ligase
MEPVLRGIEIYGRFIAADDLPSFCYQQLKNKDIPSWEQKIFKFLLDFLGPADFIVQKSSGTTGIPKEFKIPKKSMVYAAGKTIKMLDLHGGQSALLCLPVDYIAGKMMIVRALVNGMNLIRVEPSSLPDITGFGKIDFCAMVPLQVFSLLEKGNDLSQIGTLIIGGAELSVELERRLLSLSGNIFETFGMAETCSHIALRRVNGSRAESCFSVLPGVKISTDTRNCLVLKASYISGKIITNDVVEIMNPRKFHWKGRFDNLINSGGIKINPEELEKIIFKLLGIESYIIGIPDDKLGQGLVLVANRSYSPGEKATILKKLRTVLPIYHNPGEIVTITSFPRNESFKIDRVRLIKQVVKILRSSH